MDNLFEREVEMALEVLRNGGVILYPTDTVWGLGCDATNEKAVQRIYEIKKRPDSKSMIILVADERSILQYTAAPDLAVFDFIEQQERPTTVVFENAVGLPDNLVADNGSVAIRISRDEFCRHLIKRLKRPIVSTSANESGQPTPQTFGDISDDIKRQADYVVQWRKNDNRPAQASQIVKWNGDGTYEYIRK
jgi:L-threonylcarbamoyladenylate synthase